MQLFYQPTINEGINQLDDEESRHIQKVLRLTAGDTIHITDGKGFLYDAQLNSPQGKNASFQVINKTSFPAKGFFIHIAIAPTKNADRIEWFVEKAVELGIQRISFILCDNSERRSINLDRIEKKAISAMKQSGQYFLPAIHEMVPVKRLIESVNESERFIGFVDQENQSHLKELAKTSSSYIALIGPEGDFSAGELEFALKHDFKQVTLGPTRLRTETAGLAACHILNLANQGTLG